MNKFTKIIFNNKDSFSDFGLGIIDMSDIEVASEKVEKENNLTIKTGEFDDLSINIKFVLRKSKSIWDIYDSLIDWVTDINDNRLILSFLEDKYFIVKNVKISNISKKYKTHGYFDLEFICEPFKYKLNESLIELDRSKDINYTGTYDGECNIKIYGSGNIQLTINDETVQINNVNEYVELDSKLLLCLNKDKTSKTRDMIGGFPILTRGINKVSWVGSVSRVTIQPRTAYR